MDIYYKVHVFVNQNLSSISNKCHKCVRIIIEEQFTHIQVMTLPELYHEWIHCSYSQHFLYCINTVYVYMSVNPIPLRIKRLNVYNLKSAPMAWTQCEKFSSSVLHKSTTFKLQNKYVCLQNYENISLNHFVNLSLGLNCTWLNYRIHVAPTAYRTFFVTTIFEITGCTPQLYMYVRLVRHKVF